MSDIFISYASADRARVKPLVEALQQQGWSVWWDRAIRAGQTFDQVIEAALGEARCVIVLWSRESVKSHWVRTEAHEGQRRGILVPARLEDVVIPLAFRIIQAADLVDWEGALPHVGVQELVQAVSGILPNATPRVGQVRTNAIDGLEYVWIPPGRFTMGWSLGDGECEDREKLRHDVEITLGFWMGRTPVTQAAYKKIMGKNHSYFKGTNHPVERITWEEANDYANAVDLRLPTEAEWEYAARAGSNEAYYGALDRIAWYRDNSKGRTHPVASKDPNVWGLHDMLGSVWEWCSDWSGDYALEGQKDPAGPPRGDQRVLRGGSSLYTRLLSKRRLSDDAVQRIRLPV